MDIATTRVNQSRADSVKIIFQKKIAMAIIMHMPPLATYAALLVAMLSQLLCRNIFG